jgi:putative copper export protein
VSPLAPLQFEPFAVFGGVFLLFVLILVVSVVVAAGASYWVYTDAQKRGRDDATLWAVGTLGGFLLAGVGGFAVLVVYLLVRGD